RASLGALFAEPAVRHVVERGGEVHAGHAVRNIERRAHGYTIDGMHYDAVVIATAPQHAAALLPETCADSRALIAALDYQPIYTCYLQYEAQIRLPEPMLGFCGGPVQWAFDRGVLDGHHGLIATVIRARGTHEGRTNDE